MANFTFADYISTTLAFLNEDRDTPANNTKVREDDVKNAINKGRHKMLRQIELACYRVQTVMDATPGDITPPGDFFSDATIRYTRTGGSVTHLPVYTSKHLDKNTPNWENTTGTPSSYAWRMTTGGIKIRLVPQPVATEANALTWDYTALLDDLVEDDDECPIMNLFPEFQMTTLQSGAIRILSLLEGGEDNEMFITHSKIHDMDIAQIRSQINRLFAGNETNLGNR